MTPVNWPRGRPTLGTAVVQESASNLAYCRYAALATSKVGGLVTGDVARCYGSTSEPAALLAWLNRQSRIVSPRDGLMVVLAVLWICTRSLLPVAPPPSDVSSPVSAQVQGPSVACSEMTGVVGSEKMGSAVGEKRVGPVSEDADPIRHAM